METLNSGKVLEQLNWGDGVWYIPGVDIDYDLEYFEDYRQRDRSPMGPALTRARVDFVERHIGQEANIVDIGVGGGAFVMSYTNGKRKAYGYDINPHAVKLLQDRQLWLDPYDGIDESISAITLWDSFEHLDSHTMTVGGIGAPWIFMSLPIFDSKEHVLSSKHFKPGEHLWYFTHSGLITYMTKFYRPYQLIATSDIETALGREGIRSYAFKRST